MMKQTCKFFALAGLFTLAYLPAFPASAYPALYVKYRRLYVPHSFCLEAAQRTIQGAGFANVQNNASGSGGTTNTARAYIACIPLPKAGACGLDGTSVVFSVASDRSGDDALAVLGQLDTRFGNPTLIDCGTGSNPVTGG